MQRTTLLVLLLLALGLGAYVYLYEIRGADERQASDDAEKQLFKVDKEVVTALSIQNGHGTFSITHRDKHWFLTSPLEAPADTSAVEDVIYAMDAMRYTRVVEENPSDLTTFGLATPRFKITLETPTGPLSLLIGDDAPFGGEVYVKREDTPKVYLTGYPLTVKIDKDLLGWRDKKIVDFAVPEVQKVSIEGPDFSGLDAVRQGERWSTSGTAPQRLEASAMETLLYDLQGMTAQSFSGQSDPTLFGLQAPALTVTLELGADKAREQIMFGAPFGEGGMLPVIRQSGEEVILVDAAVFPKIKKSSQELRSMSVVEMQRVKVDRLEATVDGQTMAATREKDEWKIDGSLKEKVKPSDVEAILDDLGQLKAQSTVEGVANTDLARYGLANPALKLVIHEEGTTQDVKLALGQTDGGDSLVYARVEGDSTVYQLNRFLLEDIRDVLLKPVRPPPSDPGAMAPGMVAPEVAAPGSGASGLSPSPTGESGGTPAP